MTAHFNKKANQIIRDRIISENKKIEVVPGKCRYNFRCSYNAVHEAHKNKHKKIAMVVYFDGNHPIIHFLNYHKGVYTDNTLGQWSLVYNYYLIKFIDKEDFWDVNVIFTKYRATLQTYLPFFTRIFNTETF